MRQRGHGYEKQPHAAADTSSPDERSRDSARYDSSQHQALKLRHARCRSLAPRTKGIHAIDVRLLMSQCDRYVEQQRMPCTQVSDRCLPLDDLAHKWRIIQQPSDDTALTECSVRRTKQLDEPP